MAKKVILGADIARDAFKIKVNENFTELYDKDVALAEQINDLVTQIGNIDITNLKQDQTGDIPLDTVKGLVFGYSSIMQNKTGSYWCIVETIQFTSTYKIQKVYTFVDKILVRTMNANIWGDWREIITDKQPNWIAATLMNGWTEELYYTKNDLGLVTIRANILAGTTVADFTHIGVIPSGYRPNIEFVVIPLVDFSTGNVKFMYVNSTTGNITIAPNQSFINNHKYTGIVTYYVN